MKPIATAIMLSAFAGVAMAHEGMHGPGSEYDTDEDGGLSLVEYTAYLKETRQDVAKAAARFAALDANKDKELSSGEFAKGLADQKKAPR
jgi:hypothetical protein